LIINFGLYRYGNSMRFAPTFLGHFAFEKKKGSAGATCFLRGALLKNVFTCFWILYYLNLLFTLLVVWVHRRRCVRTSVQVQTTAEGEMALFNFARCRSDWLMPSAAACSAFGVMRSDFFARRQFVAGASFHRSSFSRLARACIWFSPNIWFSENRSFMIYRALKILTFLSAFNKFEVHHSVQHREHHG